MAATGSVTFFFDENMPRRLAEALSDDFGESATHLYHHFGRDGILDPAVLRYVGERGWFLITRDRKILRRSYERAVIEELAIGVFFLNDSLNDFCSIVRALIHNWPEIKRLARTRKRPFAFLVRERGLVPLRNRHIH